MIISIINMTQGKVSDEEMQRTIRAINKQITEDFEPYWSFGARLRLEGSDSKKPAKESLLELRGDALIYVWDKMDVSGAIGYHETNNRGIPYGLVWVELSDKLQEPWSVTLSHEALELIGDPQINLLVQGPHPEDLDKKKQRMVFHWFEMSDAVQSDFYEIDGIPVSNFLLPLYFTGGEQVGSRNDFLGRTSNGKLLQSFGVRPGGYIGFFDPVKNKHITFFGPDDTKAAQRAALKGKVLSGRGTLRKTGSLSPLTVDPTAKKAAKPGRRKP
jgi:hypothetical protein